MNRDPCYGERCCKAAPENILNRAPRASGASEKIAVRMRVLSVLNSVGGSESWCSCCATHSQQRQQEKDDEHSGTQVTKRRPKQRADNGLKIYLHDSSCVCGADRLPYISCPKLRLGQRLTLKVRPQLVYDRHAPDITT